LNLVDLLSNPNPDVVKQFLVHWHGERQPLYGIPAVQLEGIAMPSPLRDFYEFAGRWPGLVVENGPILFLDPAQLTQEEGKAVFCVENQGVYLWATALQGEDAPVWGRFTGAGEPWVEEEEPLARFLLQVILFLTVFLAREGAAVAWLGSDDLERVLRPLRALPVGDWRWPDYPTRFYAGEGVVAVSSPNRGPESGSQVSLWIGARDRKTLVYLDDIVDRSWQYYSPRDRT
jgi:hypothetical protein